MCRNNCDWLRDSSIRQSNKISCLMSCLILILCDVDTGLLGFSSLTAVLDITDRAFLSAPHGCSIWEGSLCRALQSILEQFLSHSGVHCCAAGGSSCERVPLLGVLGLQHCLDRWYFSSKTAQVFFTSVVLILRLFGVNKHKCTWTMS